MTSFEIDPVSGLPIGKTVEAAQARRPDRATVLEGRYVRLVGLDPALHGDALHARAHGPEAASLWLYLGGGPFADRAGFDVHLDAMAAATDPLAFTIVDQGSGAAVGHATFMRIEPAHRVIEVGNILFTPALQRSPGATEAMYLMARHAFEDLGYRRYEWKCNALNAPSRRAAERYGFTYEGLFRDHMIMKGRSRDTAWFSMLAAEWPVRRAAFARWLDPGNFDETGRQRLALSALNARTIPSDPGLRRADLSDAAALGRLQEAAYAPNRAILGAEPLPLLTSAEDVLGRDEVWLACDGQEPAAALILDPQPDHLLVWSVAVLPARQGQRWGTRLLEAAEARARALGLRELRLYTGEKLVRNIRLYERHGYVASHVEAIEARRIVHMSKRITGGQDDRTARG